MVAVFNFAKIFPVLRSAAHFRHFWSLVSNFASIHGDDLSTMQQCSRKPSFARRNGERSAFQTQFFLKSTVSKRWNDCHVQLNGSKQCVGPVSSFVGSFWPSFELKAEWNWSKLSENRRLEQNLRYDSHRTWEFALRHSPSLILTLGYVSRFCRTFC